MVSLLAVCFAFALTACNNSESDEFTSLQSFEYHFFPEEYEKEYSEHEKTIHLKQIQIINLRWMQLVKVEQ